MTGISILLLIVAAGIGAIVAVTTFCYIKLARRQKRRRQLARAAHAEANLRMAAAIRTLYPSTDYHAVRRQTKAA